MGTPLVPFVMFTWIPVVLVIFSLVRPRRAVITAFIIGLLFLPISGYPLPGFTDYTKTTATAMGVMLGVAIFDGARLGAFRPKLWDLPMLVFLVSPFLTSVYRGYGAYDGLSEVIYQSLTWGVPYLMGRLYLTDPQAMRELAVGVFIGGLVYLPLVIWEIRMSPQIHHFVYGYHPAAFHQTLRFGGYRPVVFMQHGLMCATWMCAATLIGYWLWKSKSLVRLYQVPIGALVLVMAGVSVWCKSVGAAVFTLIVAALLWTAHRTGVRALVLIVLIAAPVYTAGRVGGLWTGAGIVEVLESIPIVKQRVASVTYRLENNDLLIEKAMRAPLLGWGKNFHVIEQTESGAARRWSGAGKKNVTTSDSYWTIVLGKQGLIGLTAWLAAMVGPLLWVLCNLPARQWNTPRIGGLVAVVATVMLFTLDSILNAMVNPVFIFGLGGVTYMAGASAWLRGERRADAPARPRATRPAAQPAGAGGGAAPQGSRYDTN